jgi:DNA-binding winged helix-turn-helix (wHTH) protein/Flp pilus assembly protein TadD
MPLQQELLLVFVRHPKQILTQKELISRLWPGKKAAKAQHPALNLAVHRLRQVFAQGPLGIEVIRSIYGKGYCFEATVELMYTPKPKPDGSPSAPLSASKQTLLKGYDRSMASRLFYFEAHEYWPNRDPYRLPRQQWLLQQSLECDPSFSQGRLELCYFYLLQCLWGVRTAASTLPDLQSCLDIGDQQASQAPGWEAIKAETMSLMLWQPQISQRLYGNWLGPSLPAGLPRFSFARHLIFTGRPRQALRLMADMLHQDLSQGWLVQSMAHCALGDIAAAEQAAQQQLRVNPGLVGSKLFLAMLGALRGEAELATRLVEEIGILERPFQGSLSMVCYALAQGRLAKRANQLLDEALALVSQDPDAAGALGYWGLAALELDRSYEAISLLKLSVRRRCYAAPVLMSTPFLEPHRRTPAAQLFRERMDQAFVITAK